MQKNFYVLVTFFVTLFFSQAELFSQQFSLLKDINPGPGGSNTNFRFVNVNGILFFTADDGIHGLELWKSDGTAAGTVMVKDIYAGPGQSVPNICTNVNGVLFFSASDGVNGEELWKSNGTEAGTVMVKDINAGAASTTMSSFANINGTLYFNARTSQAGSELWKSDGTAAGTVMIRDLYPGVETSGLGAGTPFSGNPTDFTYMNGYVYFTASEGPVLNRRKLWRTDGTEAGTTIVSNVNSVTSPLYNLIAINNVLYFTIYRGIYETELWKSDGTPAGTVQVAIISGFDAFTQPHAYNGLLYFISEGLWRSDGTAAGTYTLKHRDYSYPSNPELLTISNNQLFFTGYDATNGWELWKSNGTIAGTSLVEDINPTGNCYASALTSIGNRLLFAGDDGTNGKEVWTSDGTVQNTSLVQDIQTGSIGSDPASFIRIGNKIFTNVQTSDLGREVWVTQLTEEIGLPLDLLDFKGIIANGNGVLTWKTDNEINTKSFTVERSTDGRSYNAIGSVAATNQPGTHQYNYTDQNIKSLGAPVIYFRLKQIDIDGHYTYSNIVRLALDNLQTFVMLYPNPVKNNINLTINADQKEKLQWQLMDNTGRLIKKGRYEISEGSTAVSINMDNLSSGIYFMKLNGSIFQQTIKVVKQ
jgi:ELWxxDGT repeat protein